MSKQQWKQVCASGIAFACLLLTACGPNVVQMDPLREFPRPIVDQFPADIALYYSEEFRTYTYIEERPGARGGDWEITLGPPQVQVFDMVFSSLFRSAEHADSEALPDQGPAKALFVPRVEEFQFALPVDTNIKIFEIWVKYSIGIFDSSGDEVMRWPFTAYGKTPTAFLKSNGQAINQAASIALRDAGASMISGFMRDQKLKEWLYQLESGTAPDASAVVKPSDAAANEPVQAEEDQQ